mmetsp:Transcript_4466/g.8286  ORF Transcript_4466/g.8286 Transcript_4466/m.8286 type:complete len:85 (-) Transcript_4466:115-369(-)
MTSFVFYSCLSMVCREPLDKRFWKEIMCAVTYVVNKNASTKVCEVTEKARSCGFGEHRVSYNSWRNPVLLVVELRTISLSCTLS